MCLKEVYVTKVDEEGSPAPEQGVLLGYKAYNMDSESLTLYGDFAHSIEIGKWIEAQDGLSDSEQYQRGFHIFLDKSDADNYSWNRTYLVQFKDIVAIGKNASHNKGITVIAKRMKVLKEVPRPGMH